MTNLSKCPSCAGVVPSTASVCPHCVSAMPKPSRFGKLALGVLGGIGASMTLMACYGAPPCREVTLADGGTSSNCTYEPVTQDAGTDGGVTTDGGTRSDGGVTDGGSDAGP